MKPPFDVDEGLGTGDVINHDDPVGPPIIPVGPGSVSKLQPTQDLPAHFQIGRDLGGGKPFPARHPEAPLCLALPARLTLLSQQH